MQLTFEQLPEAVSRLLFKLESIEQLLLLSNKPANAESDELLSIQQAAEFIKLSVPTVYGFVSRSEIPCMKKGKRLYFSRHELKEWIKTGRKKTITEIASEADEYLSSNKKRRLN